MKISLIIPTYNRAGLLDLLLKDLEQQTLSRDLFEVLVVDNASTDDTAHIAKRAIENNRLDIRYISENRRGLHYARNTGALEATNEILVFTDDDIYLSRQWLSVIRETFARDSSIDCVGGKIQVLWDRPPPGWIGEYEALLGNLDHGSKERVLKNGEYIYGPNFSIKKTVLLEMGGFNPDQTGDIVYGDGEIGLCIKLWKYGKIIYWQPQAGVKHLQFVDRNATKKDILRRFVNNASSDACVYYKKERPGSLRIFADILYFCMWTMGYKFLFFLNADEKNYRFFIKSAYCKKRMIFMARILFSSKHRESCLREKWM